MFLGLKRTTTPSPFEESLRRLPNQVAAVLRRSQDLELRVSKTAINKIVVNGMGGSNLGAEIVRSVFSDKLRLPLIIEPGYDVPAYTDAQTLYIISSYSGTTEEPIAAYAKAKRKGAQLFILTSDTDNKMAALARRDKTSHFLFPISDNPSDQPRLGLGYSIASCIMILKALGALSLNDKEIALALNRLKREVKRISLRSSSARILAKKMAKKEAILIGGPFLEGNLKTLRNQWCENAKNYASYLVLSDMNHFAMEGLAKPSSNPKRLAALFFESDLYDTRISRRLELTKEVIRKQKISVHAHKLSGKTRLEQAFEMLQFGSWLTYYLSTDNRVDPSAIPWVNWFKNKLTA